VSQTSSEFAKQQRQEVPASVFGPQEQNRIEPDLDQVIEKGTSEHPAKPGQSDQEHTTAEPNADIQKPSSGPTMTTASAAGDADTPEHAQKKPILDLAYKAPPDGLEVRYLFVDGKYVDVGNGVTTIFQDKGKYLATAKEDIQTVHDMVEVAKAKGWERLKLSGTPEFKRLIYIEAESQGIKTRGYQPAAEDLAMVNKRLEERSLNQVQVDPHDNRQHNKRTTPRQDAQAMSAADRFA